MGYKPVHMSYKCIVVLLTTLLVTTHEPASRACGFILTAVRFRDDMGFEAQASCATECVSTCKACRIAIERVLSYGLIYELL